MATESTRRKKEVPTAEQIREQYLIDVRDTIVEQTIRLMEIAKATGGTMNEKRDIALTVLALTGSVAIEEGWAPPAAEEK